MSPPGSKDSGQRTGFWSRSTWLRYQPTVSLLARLGVAVVFIWAAIPKLTDISQSQRSVAAYQLFPVKINDLIGVALPVIELAVGLLALVGLLTRYAAGLFGLMMLVYIVGISQAWARGLSIDCGCFSPGGALPEGASTKYGLDILRDVGFIVLALILVFWPRSHLSLDAVLRLEPAPRQRNKD